MHCMQDGNFDEVLVLCIKGGVITQLEVPRAPPPRRCAFSLMNTLHTIHGMLAQVQHHGGIKLLRAYQFLRCHDIVIVVCSKTL